MIPLSPHKESNPSLSFIHWLLLLLGVVSTARGHFKELSSGVAAIRFLPILVSKLSLFNAAASLMHHVMFAYNQGRTGEGKERLHGINYLSDGRLCGKYCFA